MRHRCRALMLQGTGSHAGKSVLVAGLCRLLARRGLRVAPFKSQNMALNAYVTADGGEMGWAQAMQAEAADLTPRVEMNPILLKPYGAARSQVVVLGKVFADVEAGQYYRLGPRLWPRVRASYTALAREAEVVVIEGAGSPAEPNLMRHDLANMRIARLAAAAVLVVGDIDRGGVFASLVGTMALLPPRDRRLVHGFLINKFRGDPALLESALRDLRRRTRRPVLGVIPFLHGLRLPEEDSVALAERSTSPPALGIAVVKLPHIANFTDFTPFESEPDVRLVYAEEPRELAGMALVILPGCKDTVADLRHIKAQGFGAALAEHVRAGGVLLGICGGYQMLGQRVDDPHGVESGGSEAGLALLPVTTTMERAKTTRRVTARWLPDGPPFEAYEIHMGRTEPNGPGRPLLAVDGRPEGLASPDGRVWGTYLHGLFDSGHGRRRVLDWARGITPMMPALDPPDSSGGRQRAYDRLADALEAALDPSVFRSFLAS